MTEQIKPWYKTWKLIPAILFIPFTLVYLTWKTKWPMPAKLVIIGIIFVSLIASASGNKSEQQSTTVETSQTEAVAETVVTPTEIPQEELTVTLKLDNLARKEIDKKATVEFDESSGLVLAKVSTANYTFLNNTEMANHIWQFFIPFATEAFTYDGVKEVKVAITSEFIDPYGKSVFDNAVSIDMLKEDFALFNWENLRFTNPKDNQQLIDKSNYFINGAIYKDVKPEKLKISFL